MRAVLQAFDSFWGGFAAAVLLLLPALWAVLQHPPEHYAKWAAWFRTTLVRPVAERRAASHARRRLKAIDLDVLLAFFYNGAYHQLYYSHVLAAVARGGIHRLEDVQEAIAALIADRYLSMRPVGTERMLVPSGTKTITELLTERLKDSQESPLDRLKTQRAAALRRVEEISDLRLPDAAEEKELDSLLLDLETNEREMDRLGYTPEDREGRSCFPWD